VEHAFEKIRTALFAVQLIVLLTMTGTSLYLSGQVKTTDETVVQKATEQFESTPLNTVSLGKQVFMLSGDGGNVVAVVDDGSTLLIDSGIASRTDELDDAIFKATARPVTRLVNTHWHFDHTGGNAFFGASGVIIIAQENVKNRLSSPQNAPLIGLHNGPYPMQGLPTVTYASSMRLQQGSEELTLTNYGPAHTDGDTVVYVTPANIAVVGDIFSNPFYPIIDLWSGGSIDGIIQTVEQILAHIDAQTKIVPGHGPVATRADLENYHDMLVHVRERVQALITAGKTMNATVNAAPTKEFDAKWGSGYLPPDVFAEMVFTSLSNAHQPGSGHVASAH
jgi:cyclase